MTRFICVVSLGLAAMAMPQIASAQSVTLDPGLYDYAHVVMLGEHEMLRDEHEHCIVDGENSKTLDELVASLTGDGQCTASNVSMTASTARADIICTDTGLGKDLTGTLEAEYGTDFYSIDSHAALGPMGQVRVNTKARRSGACPKDWNKSDDVCSD